MDQNNRKKILITGSTSGIGKATTRILAKENDLIICGRRLENLNKIKNELSSISNIKIEKSQIDIWQLFGSLRWGVICMMQAFAHLSGSINSIEKAAIGRRVSETEYDLMNMIKYKNFL